MCTACGSYDRIIRYSFNMSPYSDGHPGWAAMITKEQLQDVVDGKKWLYAQVSIHMDGDTITQNGLKLETTLPDIMEYKSELFHGAGTPGCMHVSGNQGFKCLCVREYTPWQRMKWMWFRLGELFKLLKRDIATATQ